MSKRASYINQIILLNYGIKINTNYRYIEIKKIKLDHIKTLFCIAYKSHKIKFQCCNSIFPFIIIKSIFHYKSTTIISNIKHYNYNTKYNY